MSHLLAVDGMLCEEDLALREWLCLLSVVCSSDFCHWGSRFRYQPHDKSHGEIADYIEWLDREGMTVRQQAWGIVQVGGGSVVSDGHGAVFGSLLRTRTPPPSPPTCESTRTRSAGGTPFR